MAKKTKSEVMVKHSSLNSSSTHETGKDLVLVEAKGLALVEVKGSQTVTNSLLVAQKFGKEHKHVVESIRNLAAENSAAKLYFFETQYENRGKMYPMFVMNKNGFSLLVMGFTGKEALQFKIDFINAFDKMEARLRQVDPDVEFRVKEMAHRIKEIEHKNDMLYAAKQNAVTQIMEQNEGIKTLLKELERSRNLANGYKGVQNQTSHPFAPATQKPPAIVEVKEGQVVTTSRLVAKKFRKQHSAVLRAIRYLKEDIASATGNQYEPCLELMQNIVQASDGSSNEQPYYVMNRDAYSLLMTRECFNGKNALRYKVDFIKAFNEMEEMLRSANAAGETQLTVAGSDSKLAEMEKFRHKDSLSILNYEIKTLMNEANEAMLNKMLKMLAEVGNSVLAMQGETYSKIAAAISGRLRSIDGKS
jgi:Rha family phage regulatory protein